MKAHGLNSRLKALLDYKAGYYNQHSFVRDDPISVPHRFTGKTDREIAAFFSATLAWGTRKSIVKSGLRLMDLMDDAPAAFIDGFSEKDLPRFRGFVHRTFNENDLLFFLYALKHIYQKHGGLESVFNEGYRWGRMHGTGGIKSAIMHFRDVFFRVPHLRRSHKHVSNPAAGSAAKRLNMFLRWMIRKDDAGVDLGLWNAFSIGDLYCPLDVHSGRVARGLGLLKRKQNDWKAVEELTTNLRLFDPEDPVKYDFALFGMGVFEK